MIEQSKKHLKHEILVGGISNMVFNGLIAWLLLKGGPNVGWGGSNSFVGDIIATAFILPFIVALIIIPLHKRKLASGKIDAMDFGPGSRLQNWVNRLPVSLLGNAAWFGLAGVCIAAPPPLLIFAMTGVESFTPVQYAMFKGVWAGIMAGVLVVPMVMSGLRANTSNAADNLARNQAG